MDARWAPSGRTGKILASSPPEHRVGDAMTVVWAADGRRGAGDGGMPSTTAVSAVPRADPRPRGRRGGRVRNPTVTGVLPWGRRVFCWACLSGAWAPWPGPAVWQPGPAVVRSQRSYDAPRRVSRGGFRCPGAPSTARMGASNGVGPPSTCRIGSEVGDRYRLCSGRPTGGCAKARTAGATVVLPRIPPADGQIHAGAAT
jgi:hypothetical protein